MRVTITDIINRVSDEMDMQFTASSQPSDAQVEKFVRESIRELIEHLFPDEKLHLDAPIVGRRIRSFFSLSYGGSYGDFEETVNHFGEKAYIIDNSYLKNITTDLSTLSANWKNMVLLGVADVTDEEHSSFSTVSSDQKEEVDITENTYKTPQVLHEVPDGFLKADLLVTESTINEKNIVDNPLNGYMISGNTLEVFPARPYFGVFTNQADAVTYFGYIATVIVLLYDYLNATEFDAKYVDKVVTLTKLKIAEYDEDYSRIGLYKGDA